MTTAPEVLSDFAAREALNQLDISAQLSQQSLSDDAAPAAAVSTNQPVLQARDDARVQKLRNRTQRQRARGV